MNAPFEKRRLSTVGSWEVLGTGSHMVATFGTEEECDAFILGTRHMAILAAQWWDENAAAIRVIIGATQEGLRAMTP